MNLTENVKQNEDFTQVCVWPATILPAEEVKEFEQWMLDEFGVRAQFLETITTSPDLDQDGQVVPETGEREDIFFAIHKQDIAKFAVPRLLVGVRWVEDVLSETNYSSPIYPERVFGYRSWTANEPT